jgi:hypothetical protein
MRKKYKIARSYGSEANFPDYFISFPEMGAGGVRGIKKVRLAGRTVMRTNNYY